MVLSLEKRRLLVLIVVIIFYKQSLCELYSAEFRRKRRYIGSMHGRQYKDHWRLEQFNPALMESSFGAMQFQRALGIDVAGWWRRFQSPRNSDRSWRHYYLQEFANGLRSNMRSSRRRSSIAKY